MTELNPLKYLNFDTKSTYNPMQKIDPYYSEPFIQPKKRWYTKFFKQPKPLFYMVLGFRDLPVNPNDWGITYEADNPYSLSLDWAKKVAQKVTDNSKEKYGVQVNGLIVEIYASE